MRHLWLAACVVAPLLPGLALAQSADATPPPAGPMSGPMSGPMDGHGMQGGWGKEASKKSAGSISRLNDYSGRNNFSSVMVPRRFLSRGSYFLWVICSL